MAANWKASSTPRWPQLADKLAAQSHGHHVARMPHSLAVRQMMLGEYGQTLRAECFASGERELPQSGEMSFVLRPSPDGSTRIAAPQRPDTIEAHNVYPN